MGRVPYGSRREERRAHDISHEWPNVSRRRGEGQSVASFASLGPVALLDPLGSRDFAPGQLCNFILGWDCATSASVPWEGTLLILLSLFLFARLGAMLLSLSIGSRRSGADPKTHLEPEACARPPGLGG